MRQIVGKQVRELTAEQYAALAARYDGVHLDVGTGDGRRLLHLARQ